MHENIGSFFLGLFLKYGYCNHDGFDDRNESYYVYNKFEEPVLGYDPSGIRYLVHHAINNVYSIHVKQRKQTQTRKKS